MKKRQLFAGIRNLLIYVIILTNLFATNVYAENEPEIYAESAILIEINSGKILYEKNIHQKVYPASLTKLLTAMVALDYFAPETLITVGTEINEISLDASKAGHTVGETLSAENLIRALIIPSGNDSANVLAAAVSQKAKNNENLSYSIAENFFTELMNEKAKELGAINSSFSNAHGYHDDTHYTTAYDMSLIVLEALKYDTIKQIGSEKSFSGNGAGESLENSSTLKTNTYNWASHNLLITPGTYNYKYATGLKTGFTDEAGSCVAATAEKGGVELLAIVFNSEDPNRWLDAANLFEFGFNDFEFFYLQKDGDIVDTVGLAKHNKLNGDIAEIIVKDDVLNYVSTDKTETIEYKITYYDNYLAENENNENNEEILLKAPIEKDTEIGTIVYTIDGEEIYEGNVYTSADIQKNTVFSVIKYSVKNIFTLNGLIVTAVILVVLTILVMLIRFLRRKKRRKVKYKYSKKIKR